MAHNIVVLQGQQICKKCGRTHDWSQSTCLSHPHNITVQNGKLICTKCGRTHDWSQSFCR